MTKATAVLLAVGYVPISEHLPFEACPTSNVASDTVHDHQQTTWHAGWVGCGRAIPGNWSARERPALAWLASGSSATDHGSMIVM